MATAAIPHVRSVSPAVSIVRVQPSSSSVRVRTPAASLQTSPSQNQLPNLGFCARRTPPSDPSHSSRSLACGALAGRPPSLGQIAQAEQARQQTLESQIRTGDFHLTVADCMTHGQLVVARKDTTVYEALEALVEHRITGMPVVDDLDRVIGVVSDYDLLALDEISGTRPGEAPAVPTNDLFPAPNSTWKAFKEIQKLLHKAKGQTVGDVMTPHPLTVRGQTNLEDGAKVLLSTRVRRLPVVDESGKLLGLLTRGNVIRAALMLRRAAEGKGIAPVGGN